MNNIDPDKLTHDIESKCASLKSAAKILKDCAPEEKKELLALMKESAQELVRITAELEKTS